MAIAAHGSASRAIAALPPFALRSVRTRRLTTPTTRHSRAARAKLRPSPLARITTANKSRRSERPRRSRDSSTRDCRLSLPPPRSGLVRLRRDAAPGLCRSQTPGKAARTLTSPSLSGLPHTPSTCRSAWRIVSGAARRRGARWRRRSISKAATSIRRSSARATARRVLSARVSRRTSSAWPMGSSGVALIRHASTRGAISG